MSRIKHIFVKPADPAPYVNKVFVELQEKLYDHALERLNGDQLDAGEVFQLAAYKTARYPKGLLKCKDEDSRLRYLKKVVDNCVSDYLTAKNGGQQNSTLTNEAAPTKKVEVRQKPLSWEKLIETYEPESGEESIEDQIELKMLIEEAVSHLESIDLRIITMWNNGYTQEEISNSLGLSRTTVGYRYRNCRDKLERLGCSILEEVEL